jgi:hypothetical protein
MKAGVQVLSADCADDKDFSEITAQCFAAHRARRSITALSREWILRRRKPLA